MVRFLRSGILRPDVGVIALGYPSLLSIIATSCILLLEATTIPETFASAFQLDHQSIPPMTLLRLPFLLVAAISMHVAVTPPHTAMPSDHVKSSTFRETFLMRTVIVSYLLTVTLLWFIVLGELAAILSPYLPSISGVPLQTPPTTLPFTFVLGSLFIISAGLLRWLCYHALGRFFTFELSIQSDHRLITKGPYSFVRHPSYTGTLLLTIGLSLMYGPPDSWLRTSGILDYTLLKIVVVGWSGVTLVMTTSLFARATHEDKLMRDRFGKEWDQWASVVRYRIVPGIY